MVQILQPIKTRPKRPAYTGLSAGVTDYYGVILLGSEGRTEHGKRLLIEISFFVTVSSLSACCSSEHLVCSPATFAPWSQACACLETSNQVQEKT